jgi:hypothetical protein
MPGAFANPESGARITSGPERTLVKPFDHAGIGGRFGENRERKFGHADIRPAGYHSATASSIARQRFGRITRYEP